MIQNEHYINIQGWMVRELGLKGNELMAYALIYGFSQDGCSVFSGSLTYVAEWLNCTKRAAINIVRSLVDKGLVERIEKVVNNVILVDYKISSQGVKNFQGGGEKFSGGGGEKFSPHNIDIDNIEIKENKNINIFTKENEKKSYGEFGNVKLTDAEYAKLESMYDLKLKMAIDILDGYIATKKKDPYKNHYAVMRTNGWVWEECEKREYFPDRPLTFEEAKKREQRLIAEGKL